MSQRVSDPVVEAVEGQEAGEASISCGYDNDVGEENEELKGCGTQPLKGRRDHQPCNILTQM